MSNDKRKTSQNYYIKYFLKSIANEQYNPVEVVYHYGSREKDRDIDLLVITRERNLDNSFISYGQLDVIFISKGAVQSLIELRDPIIMEPIINGEVVYGKPLQLQKLNMNEEMKRKTISYLYEKGMADYSSSLKYFSMYKNTNIDEYFRRSIINLGYAYSYVILSFEYRDNFETIITLSELLKKKEYILLKELLSYTKLIKFSPAMIDEEKNQYYTDSFTDLISSLRTHSNKNRLFFPKQDKN